MRCPRVRSLAPVVLTVLLQSCPQAPTAVLTAPEQVELGQPFTLDASGSTGAGPLRHFRWKSLDADALANLPRDTEVVTDTATLTVQFADGQHLNPGRYVFSVIVEDDAQARSEPATVAVNVVHTEHPTAVLSAPATVRLGDSFTLNGAQSFATAPLGLAEYRWSNLDFAASSSPFGPGQSLITTSSTLRVNVGRDATPTSGRFGFQLVVVDEEGVESAPTTFQIVVVGGDRPTAVLDAPVQVNLGVPFTLSGARSAASPPATITRYRWSTLTADFGTFKVGTPVDTAVAQLPVAIDPAMPAPPGRYDFQLVVTDSTGADSEPTEVRLLIADRDAPTAVLSAPPSTSLDQAFDLDGSHSFDPEGQVVKWAFTNEDCLNVTGWAAGVTVTQTTPVRSVVPTASHFSTGTCRFSLVVTDEAGNASAPTLVQVSVADRQRPTAVLNAPVRAPLTRAFLLDGTSSFDNGGGHVVQWAFTNTDCPNVAGWAIGATLAQTTATLTVSPGANGFAAGRCEFALLVTDDAGNVSSPDIVLVVMSDSTAPTAVLKGPITTATTKSFILDGSASFDSGGGHLVSWSFTNINCPGAAAFAIGATITKASPSLTVAPASVQFTPGRCEFQLVVTDDAGNNSLPDQLNVTIVDTQAPSAVLDGPASSSIAKPFQLSGERSFDSGGGMVVQYTFVNVDCPGVSGWAVGATLSQLTATRTVAPAAGVFAPGRCTFELVVTDDSGNQSALATRFVLLVDDQAPTAVLDGPSSITKPSFTLSGARSFDVGGTITKYEWTNKSLGGAYGFAIGATIVTSTPSLSVTAGQTGFTAGTAELQLVVTDDAGNASAPASLITTVK